MSRHFAIRFWKLIIPRQWGAHAYIPSLTDVLCPQNRNNKENQDKNRVLKAISRDKQWCVDEINGVLTKYLLCCCFAGNVPLAGVDGCSSK